MLIHFLLAYSLCLHSLCLYSLSLSHTHTHIHTRILFLFRYTESLYTILYKSSVGCLPIGENDTLLFLSIYNYFFFFFFFSFSLVQMDLQRDNVCSYVCMYVCMYGYVFMLNSEGHFLEIMETEAERERERERERAYYCRATNMYVFCIREINTKRNQNSSTHIRSLSAPQIRDLFTSLCRSMDF